MALTMGVSLDDFIDPITSELLKQLLDITRKPFLCKGSAEQLIETIQELQPIIREIQNSGVELNQTRQSQLSSLMKTLQEGVELTRQVKASSRWNVYRNIFLARKMDKIEKRIEGFIQGLVQAHTLADVHHVRSKMAERLEVLEESTRRIEQLLGMTASGGSMTAAWPLNEMGLGKPILSPFVPGLSGPRSEATADAGGIKDFEPLKTSSLEESTNRIEQLPQMRAGGSWMIAAWPRNETGLGKPMLSPFVLGMSEPRLEDTADAGRIKDFEPLKISSLEESTRLIEKLPEMRAGGGSMIAAWPRNETGLGKPILSPFVPGMSGQRSEDPADAGGIKDFEPLKNTCNSSVMI